MCSTIRKATSWPHRCRAAAAVLTRAGHEGRTYELAGDEAFTMDQLAAEINAQSGKTVPFKNLTVDEYRAVLLRPGRLRWADCGLGAGHRARRAARRRSTAVQANWKADARHQGARGGSEECVSGVVLATHSPHLDAEILAVAAAAQRKL